MYGPLKFEDFRYILLVFSHWLYNLWYLCNTTIKYCSGGITGAVLKIEFELKIAFNIQIVNVSIDLQVVFTKYWPGYTNKYNCMNGSF